MILIDPTIMSNTRRNAKNFVSNNEKRENGKSVNINQRQGQDLELDRDRVRPIRIIHALQVQSVSW